MRPRDWIPSVAFVGKKVNVYLLCHEEINDCCWKMTLIVAKKQRKLNTTNTWTARVEQQWANHNHNHNKSNRNAWQTLNRHEKDLKDSCNWLWHWGARPACAQARSRHPTSLGSASGFLRDKKCGNKVQEMQLVLAHLASFCFCTPQKCCHLGT